MNQDLQDFEDFLIRVVDSNGACRSMRITFSLAIFYLGGNNHFILYLNAFHQCDHRIDEKKVIKVTIFYLHLTQTKDVIFHPENPVNPDSNPITGKYSTEYHLRSTTHFQLLLEVEFILKILIQALLFYSQSGYSTRIQCHRKMISLMVHIKYFSFQRNILHNQYDVTFRP